MDNKARIRKLYEEGLNPRKLTVIDEIIADNYEGIYGAKGPDGFRQTIQPLLTAFPDITWTIEDIFAEGDRVAVRWTWQGTNDGPLRTIPATHKQIHDSGIVIYAFQDSKVVKAWVQTDRLGLLQQLGAIPPDASMSKPAAK